MTRSKKIVDFLRCHGIKERPAARARPRRRRRPGEETTDMWGPFYWPFGFRTWMFLTGIVPVAVLFVLWCFGWREPFEELGPMSNWFFTPED